VRRLFRYDDMMLENTRQSNDRKLSLARRVARLGRVRSGDGRVAVGSPFLISKGLGVWVSKRTRDVTSFTQHRAIHHTLFSW
jgi:hypothetical protein